MGGERKELKMGVVEWCKEWFIGSLHGVIGQPIMGAVWCPPSESIKIKEEKRNRKSDIKKSRGKDKKKNG